MVEFYVDWKYAYLFHLLKCCMHTELFLFEKIKVCLSF